MRCFAATQFRSQRLDEAARAQDTREGVIALGAVELESQFAGQVNPDRHFFLFPRGGIGFSQALDNLPPNEVAEQVRLGGFGDMLQTVDLTLAQSVQHEAAVVLESQEVHYFLRRRAAGLGGGRRRAFSKRSMWATIRRCSLTSAARAWRKRR